MFLSVFPPAVCGDNESGRWPVRTGLTSRIRRFARSVRSHMLQNETSPSRWWLASNYTLAKSRGRWSSSAAGHADPQRLQDLCLGMGGQRGGMVNESGHFPEVCKKSLQAMAADMGAAIPSSFWSEHGFEELRRLSPRELEGLGRLVEPLHAGPLDDRYRPIVWSEAMDLLVDRLRRTTSTGPFLLQRKKLQRGGIPLQLFARLYGTTTSTTAPTTATRHGSGLASVTGSAPRRSPSRTSTTVTPVPHGGNPASNHPRFMRSLMELKRPSWTGGLINPMRGWDWSGSRCRATFEASSSEPTSRTST